MKPVLVVCPNPAIDIYAWVEAFKNGVPNRILKEARYPGGKGLHVAMALAEMKIPVIVAGFWGGEAGQWIQKAANTYYPEIKFAGSGLEEWSRSCYTFKSEDEAFDDTEILGTGPNVNITQFKALMDSVERLLPNASAVALCGSWPKGSPEIGYQQIIELCNQQRIKSFLDCTGNQLKHGLKANPYAIHLNRKEATEFSRTNDFEKARRQVLQNCKVAAVTDGSKGLYYTTAENTYHSLAKVEQVISSIGSGDCLLAGIIAGFIKGYDHQHTANLGAACGAANCLREDLGMLYNDDVERLFVAARV